MPSPHNKTRTADSKTVGEQQPKPRPNNFLGGVWINGVWVDVEGRIAPYRAGAITGPDHKPSQGDRRTLEQPSKTSKQLIDLQAMD